VGGLKSKKPLRARVPIKKESGKVKKRVPLEKKPITKLVAEADKWFSQYIRLRDSVRDGDAWIGTCVTCSKTSTVAYIDNGVLKFDRVWSNGHYVSRGNWVTRFEEENNNLQCKFNCNKMKSGNLVKYKSELKLRYGDQVPEKLEKMADEQPGRTYRFTRQELLQIISDSKEAINFYLNHP
jgi:hypothetical protein